MVSRIGTNGNDTLEGTSGEDGLNGLGGDDSLIGLGNVDLLLGGEGKDTLDGSTGGDLFYGGAGDDLYLVDDVLDLVSEKQVNSEEEFFNITTLEQLQSLPDAGGTDLVFSSIDYILPTDISVFGTVENLTLEGEANLIGTGNNLDNFITGNGGVNLINGAEGNDTLIGNAGDDLLSGDEGTDSFIYVSELTFTDANFGSDTIGDFTSGEDVIVLSANTFGLTNTNGAGLSSADFTTVDLDAEVSTSSGKIVFSTESSTLFYNPNGSEAGLGIDSTGAAFLTLLDVTELNPATDFVVTGERDNSSSDRNLVVYRYLNNDTGVHFYTANEAEREVIENELLSNFSFEGASYLSIEPLTGAPSPSPVYRFLNQDTGVHLYTISETEREVVDNELANFDFEGEAFYAYPTQVMGTIPIYRFFNPTTEAHFYTPSAAEKEVVENELSDFQFEGIAYYAFPVEEVN